MKYFGVLLLGLLLLAGSNTVAQCNNLALGKPATASETWDTNEPGNAFDGNCGNMWNSGTHPYGSGVYVQVDLLATHTINNINLMFQQTPSPDTTSHIIYTSPDMITWLQVDSFTGLTATGEVIERCFSSAPLANVRGVRVKTTKSPSWVAWREIGVFELSPPADTPSITASSLTLCQADSAILTCSTGASYLWNNGETTQSIVVKTPGNYCVSVGGTGSCISGTTFCTACALGGTACVTIAASALHPSASPDTTICQYSQVQLHASGGSTYQWAPATGLTDSNIADPIAMPFNTTTYSVTISTPGCADSTVTVDIHVNSSPPTPVITKSNDTLYCSIDPTYSSYQWYADSAIITGATAAYLKITKSGNYNVQVTNEYGCSTAVGINVILGLNNYSSHSGSITLSPNPARNKFTIRNSQFTIRGIEIYNILGEKIYSNQFEIGNPKSEIKVDVSIIETGMYFVKLMGRDNEWTGKFIKE